MQITLKRKHLLLNQYNSKYNIQKIFHILFNLQCKDNEYIYWILVEGEGLLRFILLNMLSLIIFEIYILDYIIYKVTYKALSWWILWKCIQLFMQKVSSFRQHARKLLNIKALLTPYSIWIVVKTIGHLEMAYSFENL